MIQEIFDQYFDQRRNDFKIFVKENNVIDESILKTIDELKNKEEFLKELIEYVDEEDEETIKYLIETRIEQEIFLNYRELFIDSLKKLGFSILYDELKYEIWGIVRDEVEYNTLDAVDLIDRFWIHDLDAETIESIADRWINTFINTDYLI